MIHNYLYNEIIISNSLLRPNAKVKRDSIDIKSKTSLVDDWLNITMFDSIDGNLSLAVKQNADQDTENALRDRSGSNLKLSEPDRLEVPAFLRRQAN